MKKNLIHVFVLIAVVISLLSFVYSCGVVRFHIGESRLDQLFDLLTADGELSDSDVMALAQARLEDQQDAEKAKLLFQGLKGAATGDWVGIAEKVGGLVLGTGVLGYGAHKASAHLINRQRDNARRARKEPTGVPA